MLRCKKRAYGPIFFPLKSNVWKTNFCFQGSLFHVDHRTCFVCETVILLYKWKLNKMHQISLILWIDNNILQLRFTGKILLCLKPFDFQLFLYTFSSLSWICFQLIYKDDKHDAIKLFCKVFLLTYPHERFWYFTCVG